MHFPRFWKKAVIGKMIAWGWSDISPDEALSNAQSRVERLRKWISCETDIGPGGKTEYGYPDRPMREEVLREFQNEQGQPIAVVSRNRPGAGC